MIRILALAGIALALAGTTAADSRTDRHGDSQKGVSDLDRALAGRSPGTPQNCIDPSFASGRQIIDGTTILYRAGGRVWRNTLDSSCPGLTPDATLISESFGGQLCRGDRVRALERGSHIPGPWCRLGSFVPYAKVKP